VSPVVDAVSPVVDVVSPVVDVVSPVVDVVSPVVDVVSPVVDASPVADVVSPVMDDPAVPDAALQPVPEPVTDVAPLLVTDFVPGTVDDDTVMVLSASPAAGTGASVSSTGLSTVGPLSSLTPCGILTGPLSTLLVSAAAGSGFQAGTGAAGGPSGGAMPEPMPAPAAGSGSGQSSGGSQTPAAWLSSNFEHLSLPGSVPVSGPIQHLPAPVSFDPGSSPD
jgi:hypothetical protein